MNRCVKLIDDYNRLFLECDASGWYSACGSRPPG